MKKQSLIRGTLILGGASLISRFLGLFFRWPLMMLIGDEGMGYYQMSYPLYMFFIAIASGIPVAVSKMVSEKNAIGDEIGAKLVLKKALFLMIFMGIGFSITIFIFSKQIIHVLKWDSNSYYSLIGISVAPIFISIMASFRGYFQGLQNMTPTAISELIEQIGRVIFGVGLAYIFFSKGIEYSAGGASLGAAAGGLIGGLYLVIRYIKMNSIKKHNSKDKKSKREGILILNKLLMMAIPISIGSTVGTIMSLIDSVLVPQKLLNAGFTYKEAAVIYGQLSGKAFVLVNIPLALSIALCASLVPIIAEMYVLKRKVELVNKIETAFKFSAVISIPSCLGLFFLSAPILQLIFPGRAAGDVILKYLALSIPFIIIAQTSTALLQGVGKYAVPVINLLMGCIIKIVLTFLLVPIPGINIYGAITGTIAGYFTAALLNMLYIRKSLNISINYYETMIRPAFASVIMIIFVVIIYIKVYNYTLSTRLSCSLAIFSGLIIYCILIILFGVFKFGYIKNKLLRK